MSIVIEEPRHFPTLGICTECRHGTEPNMPCRWCGVGRRAASLNYYSQSELMLREEQQKEFNMRMRRGII